MEHGSVHYSVVVRYSLTLPNSNGFAEAAVSVIFVVGDDWDRCVKQPVVPKDSFVVGCADVSTGISLALGVDADVAELSHLVSVGNLGDLWELFFKGFELENTFFKMEGGGGVTLPTRSFRASIGIVERVCMVSSGIVSIVLMCGSGPKSGGGGSGVGGRGGRNLSRRSYQAVVSISLPWL